MGLSKYDEAEMAFAQIISNTIAPGNIVVLAKEDYALLLVSKQDRDPCKSLALFRDVIDESGKLRSANFWAAYAYSLASCGYKEESDMVFSKLYALEEKDYSVVDIWKSSVCKFNGKYKEALSLLQNSLSYQDSLMRIAITQATTRAQKDYLALKNSQMQIDAKNKQLKLLVIIVALVVCLITLYLVYRFRSDNLKKERESLFDIAETMKYRLKESEEGRVLEKVNLEGLVSSKDSEISSLRKEIDSKGKTLSALRSEYSHMYKSQFKYLGDLCETFLLANEKHDSRRIVYEKVQDMIKNISSDRIGQKRFERMIDRSLNNIMKHFREEFPKYSEEDYRFVSYIFVGFDATTLCIIFNMPSVAAVYMKKSRIKKTIQDSQATYKEKYLEMLD